MTRIAPARNERPFPPVRRGLPGAAPIARWFLLFGPATVALAIAFGRTGGWGEALGLAGGWIVWITIAFSLAMLWLCLRVACRRGAHVTRSEPVPLNLAQCRSQGLGPVPTDSEPAALYLDLVKRAVANTLYQDMPLVFYDHHQQPVLAQGFDLSRRVMGEDVPTSAHTMIGLRRLNDIQFCVENVIRDGVPGDLVEAGVCRGGAVLFMRAVLRAHAVTDRRVFACDTFIPNSPSKPNWFLTPIMQGLGSIPSRWWQRKCLRRAQTLFASRSSFPLCQNPSDDMVDFVMWHLRNPVAIPPGGGTSLADVKSLFARYGLLDDQTVFIEGFFADTLPKAPLQRAAVIRLDGDTYESTRDAITLLYPKLSPGGYCIIDDFNAFTDCQRAVEEYRSEHAITDEIIPIDNIAVHWRKSA